MKILIIRFSSFGDVLMTSPVLKKIKKVYPDSEIDFLVYDSFSEAVTDNPNLNNIYIFPKKKSKDFEKADSIRDNLDKRGILLKDTREGTIWDLKLLYSFN